MHLATQGSGLVFGFGANQDFADSTKVIAFATAGGLSLPDRDYYTKTDPKSIEIRAQYVAHVQRIFELLGTHPETAAKDAADVLISRHRSRRRPSPGWRSAIRTSSSTS